MFFKVIVVFSSFNRTEPEKRLARIISQLRAKKKIQLDLTCYRRRFDVRHRFDVCRRRHCIDKLGTRTSIPPKFRPTHPSLNPRGIDVDSTFVFSLGRQRSYRVMQGSLRRGQRQGLT